METTPSVPPDPGAIKIWFAQIYGKIDEMNAAIFAKSGWLIFKTHAHSTDELLNDPTLESIRALCGQIDNVVHAWQQNSALDPQLVQFYYDNRILVEQKLSNLRMEIHSRKPTFWEEILQTLGHLLRLVQKLLPVLTSQLLKSFGINFDPLQVQFQERSDELDDLIDGLVRR
ncbi:MAG: hypothetical protein ACRD9W_12790 [Terriglobia bacterium]